MTEMSPVYSHAPYLIGTNEGITFTVVKEKLREGKEGV